MGSIGRLVGYSKSLRREGDCAPIMDEKHISWLQDILEARLILNGQFSYPKCSAKITYSFRRFAYLAEQRRIRHMYTSAVSMVLDPPTGTVIRSAVSTRRRRLRAILSITKLSHASQTYHRRRGVLPPASWGPCTAPFRKRSPPACLVVRLSFTAACRQSEQCCEEQDKWK